MDLIRSALLLFLLQLSPLGVHMSCEALPLFSAAVQYHKLAYKCNDKKTSDQTVKNPFALLKKGCVLEGGGITFDLDAMYKTPSIHAVVIDISDAVFNNSHIKLINAPSNTDVKVPLQFTMSKSKMTGTSKLEFGSAGQIFKLPPHSRIRIINSQLTISSIAANPHVFTFHSLQLVTNSSIEIAHNVITMEYKGGTIMDIFHLPENTAMMVSDMSSFTLEDNEINMNVHKSGDHLYQCVWFQNSSSNLTISKNSNYTWLSNKISLVAYGLSHMVHQSLWSQRDKSSVEVLHISIYTWARNHISMVGYDASDLLYQSVWFKIPYSHLTVSNTSNYTWLSNTINMLGYQVSKMLHQFVWNNLNDSPLTITENSNYKWASNNISMEVYTVKDTLQQVWFQDHDSPLAISVSSQFLLDSNRMVLLARDYEHNADHKSCVMVIKARSNGKSGGTISNGSSMKWRNNCVAMGQKTTDKRHVFTVQMSITNESELLWDGNYFTTTDKYEPSVGTELTEFVWGPTNDTAIKLNNGSTLSIRNTQVHGNNATSGATGSVLWNSSSSIYKTDVSLPAMDWSSSDAKDKSGSLIPPLDNSNLRQYMCGDLPNIPPTPPVTATHTPGVNIEPHGPIPAITEVDAKPTANKPNAPGTSTGIKPNDIPTTATVISNLNATSISATVVSSTIPAVLISSVVFLYLYNG